MTLATEWDGAARELFRALAPDSAATAPLVLLAAAPPARLAELAADVGYVAQVAAADDRARTRIGGAGWYQALAGTPPSCIAYFSPEFGVSEALPQYSGGLGVLAGDHLKAASDLGVPIVGVSLFYGAGYFRQILTAAGEQREEFPALDPSALPMSDTGVVICVRLPGAPLHARVWRVDVGRVPLLLLDAAVPENAPAEQAVTDRLYGGDREHRLRQELLLGVGGVAALEECGFAPDVWHMNEGHAGFLCLERIRRLVGAGLDADAAIEAVRGATVFTTHTPVPAGIDRFPRELVARYLDADAAEIGIPIDRLLALGDEPGGDPDSFNMAALGLRLAGRINGVSRLHGAVSRRLFAGHWPGLDPEEAPIGHITNGVHDETWIGPDFAGVGADADDETLQAARDRARARLVAEVRARSRRQWQARGLRGLQLDFTDATLEPHLLTIGFARRAPTYKRLTLMLHDPARLERLLLDAEHPVQIVIAGKSHPADEQGKALIADLGAFATRHDVRHRIVMLADYDMAMARTLVAGVDVWLNNPLRPFEACGTSGMKAALNGALNLSILDGWWDEHYDGMNGWAIPSADDGAVEPAVRDAFEAAALYDLLEREVVPRFYGDRPAWLAMVRHTLASLAPQLSATRMVRDYVTGLYTPAAVDTHRLAADGHAAAGRLASYVRRARAAWPAVAVVEATAEGAGYAGEAVTVRAVVALGDLTSDDVTVDAVAGDLVARLVADREIAGGSWQFTGSFLAPQGSCEVRVRVLPAHPDLTDPRLLSLVARGG